MKSSASTSQARNVNQPGSVPDVISENGNGVRLSYIIPTNNLYLEILSISNGTARLFLHGTSNKVYELMSRVSLSGGLWQLEQVLHRMTNENGIFTVVPIREGANSVFFWARDWTGVDENGNGIPDWWEWEYLGGFSLSANDDYDGDGISIKDEYLNHIDPNKIHFAVDVASYYVKTNAVPIQINILRGVPVSMAVLVDNTNFAEATWQPFQSKLAVNLDATEGWHQVWVGLRGGRRLPSRLGTGTDSSWTGLRLRLFSVD